MHVPDCILFVQKCIIFPFDFWLAAEATCEMVQPGYCLRIGVTKVMGMLEGESNHISHFTSRRSKIAIPRVVTLRYDSAPARRVNQVVIWRNFQFPINLTFCPSVAGSLQGFRIYESCRTMPLVGGFSRDLQFPPPPLFHSGAAPFSPQSPSSALKTLLFDSKRVKKLRIDYTIRVKSVPQGREARLLLTGPPSHHKWWRLHEAVSRADAVLLAVLSAELRRVQLRVPRPRGDAVQTDVGTVGGGRLQLHLDCRSLRHALHRLHHHDHHHHQQQHDGEGGDLGQDRRLREAALPAGVHEARGRRLQEDRSRGQTTPGATVSFSHAWKVLLNPAVTFWVTPKCRTLLHLLLIVRHDANYAQDEERLGTEGSRGRGNPKKTQHPWTKSTFSTVEMTFGFGSVEIRSRLDVVASRRSNQRGYSPSRQSATN
ncbi:hypothetical protein PR048_017628 [Dryococelus australis]|uniref:Uncharacterized protein n=1 Tax=Dryococelus australis TaxID=614101 RepID=A0ABQ9HAA4_9NEOP|nr:hypothetical protein PR048_017628 [Dryococelus australis]